MTAINRLRMLAGSLATLGLLLAGIVAFGQEAGRVPTIERKAPPYTVPSDGATMFREYCVSCHGASGRGDGPAAPALKQVPTDLTRLSANNQGTFPGPKVRTLLQQGNVLAHGNTDMPVWGNIFKGMANEGVAMMRIHNLERYIEKMQNVSR